jgi:hypothetical protein
MFTEGDRVIVRTSDDSELATFSEETGIVLRDKDGIVTVMMDKLGLCPINKKNAAWFFPTELELLPKSHPFPPQTDAEVIALAHKMITLGHRNRESWAAWHGGFDWDYKKRWNYGG